VEPVTNASPGSKSIAYIITAGFALGVVLELPMIMVAIMSGGAGHGDYVAARVLFPASMLLTLVEGQIGVLSIAVALLQFPIYGALLASSIVRWNYLPAGAVAFVHLIAAIACFGGALPDFS
jgi:hypothetical protein